MKPTCDIQLMVRIAAVLTITCLWVVAAGAQAPKSEEIRPFRIEIKDEVLKDLKERLARTRWPDPIDGSGWDYGVERDYLRKLTDHWQNKFDWREQEKKLNQFDQFVTEIDGVDMHFVHVRSKEKDAMPLVLIHGWPGSFWEFHKIIGPLTDPVAHGGKAEDAFHVVCPSLPGFAFSGKPKERGWNSHRMAKAIATLMARLGYTRYGAQGGDWGSGIAAWLAQTDIKHVAGIHITFVPVGQPTDDGDPTGGATPKELARMNRRNKELTDHRAYGAIQGTRPDTLGFGLNDSPAGLAAWIIDKFRIWSDCGGDLDKAYTKDELLTNVMIYWATDSIASSTRIYYESQHATAPAREKITVPTGVALFPYEIVLPPRRWVESRYQIAHWTEMPKGGHFAALEEPKLLVDDMRKFFKGLRQPAK